MAFYRICPYCHAHLDPGEKCDCFSERERREAERRKKEAENADLFRVEKSGQFRLAV